MTALKSGDAIAQGRLDSKNAKRTDISPNTWASGDWDLVLGNGSAFGGVPQIQIFTIMKKSHADAARDAMPGFKREQLPGLSENVLPASSVDADNETPGKKPPRGQRSESRPMLESAQRAIDELYPGGVPDHATAPNANLCRKVSAKIKEDGRPDVSDDTILRAAGRRKYRK